MLNLATLALVKREWDHCESGFIPLNYKHLRRGVLQCSVWPFHAIITLSKQDIHTLWRRLECSYEQELRHHHLCCVSLIIKAAIRKNRLIRVFYLQHNLQHLCSSELQLAFGCATVSVTSLLIAIINRLLVDTYKTPPTD